MMLLKTSFAVVCMASVASATFFPVMPKCWRKCAREAGVMCQWTDIPCLCKTANNGLHAKANSCACHSCGDDEFGNDDKAKVQLKEFSFACKVAMTPLDQAVIDAAYSAATCPGTDAPSSPPSAPGYGYGPPPPPAPPGYGNGPPPPPAPPAPSPPGYGYGPPPPPGPLPPPQGSHAPLTSPYVSVTVIPTSLFKPSSAAASPSSKSAGYGYGIGSGAYDSTQIIQSTVMVSPVPVTQVSTSGGKTTTKTGTGTTTITGSKATATGTGTKTSAKPTQFTGAAIRRDITGSVFALAAALAYGIA